MAEEGNDSGITVKKSDNLAEWYQQVTLKSELIDYGPLHGTIAFRPYSYAIWENLQEAFNRMIKKTGHKNAYFPLLIPEGLLKKEAEHFKGFSAEAFWVTYNGDEELKERLAIRPTSETIIYYFMARWIRSWRDLPMLLNQWCNILRAEIKDTKPFLRTSEFLWQEGHTAHETEEEAEKEAALILDMYKDIVENYLAVPVIAGRKSDLEKFSGAVYTMSLEAMMPDGKAVQVATSHHLGQNFSKPFDIKFLGKDNQRHNAWTTSWGISTRSLGAAIMAHGDDKGLVMPPKVAPIQIVIVPIFKEQSKEQVLAFANGVMERVSARHSVELDTDETSSPGYKFNRWEMKGVPIRIEVGPKDVEKNQVILVRRDTGQKTPVPIDQVGKEVGVLLNSIQDNMFAKAKKMLDDSISDVKDYEELKRVIKEKGGFVRVNWCGSDDCELKIKEDTTATSRVIPFKEKRSGKCVVCGKKTDTIAYFAKSY